MKGQNRRGRKVSCEWVSRQLDAYLDGELNQARADMVRAHLDVCPYCAAQAQEGQEIRALIASCEEAVPDAALHDSIMQSIKAQPRNIATKKTWPRAMWARSWRLGGVLIGACLLFVLMLLPGSLFKANAPQSPSYEYDAPSAEAPGGALDGTLGGGSYGDEDMENSGAEDEAPGYGSESPKDPMPAPGEDPDGDSWSDDVESLLSGEIKLARDGGEEYDGTDLWNALNGAWLNGALRLHFDTRTSEVCIITKQDEYYGDISLNGDQLLLQMETGVRMKFEVKMEGDTLCLTRLQ